jgi:prophage regulatory protein
MTNVQQPLLQPAGQSCEVAKEPMVRLLSKRQLKEMVLYTGQHIQRLEDAGKFPKRVRLGDGPRGRVGWLESEVLEWLRERIEARNKEAGNAT